MRSTGNTIKVVPVRFERGKGWIMCATHRAEQWAIAFFRRGQRVVLGPRYATKAQADNMAVAAQRAAEGPLRNYKLGARMLKRGE